MINTKFYWYIFVPFSFTEISYPLHYKLLEIKPSINYCGIYDINLNQIIINFKKHNLNTDLGELMNEIKSNNRVVNYYQEGGLKGDTITVIFKTDIRLTEYVEGKYSKLYNETLIKSKAFKQLYSQDKIAKRCYGTLSHSEAFFKAHILPLCDSLPDLDIEAVRKSEYDSPPELESIDKLLKVEI
jgi:hypothetical protein